MIRELKQMVDDTGLPRPLGWAFVIGGILFWGFLRILVVLAAYAWAMVCWVAGFAAEIARALADHLCDFTENSLEAAGLMFKPILNVLVALSKILYFLPVLFVLSLFAFGPGTTFSVMFQGAAWLVAHPGAVLTFISWIAMGLMGFAGIIIIQLLFRPEYQPLPEPAPVQVRYIHVPLPRRDIENFQERSAFGDSGLSQKPEVAKSLSKDRVDSEPFFEE